MLSIQELRTSTEKELLQELAKTRAEKLKIRMQIRTKHEKNTSKASQTKRYIAQILTVLKEVKTGKLAAPKPSVKKTEKAAK